MDDAIQAAKHLYLLSPSENYLTYHLGYLYGRQGLLGLARYYYELSTREDMSHWRTLESVAFIALLDGEPDVAVRYWDEFQEKVNLLAREEQRYDYEHGLDSENSQAIPLDEFLQSNNRKWALLTDKAANTVGGESYALDLIALNESTNPIVGSHIRVGKPQFSIRKIIEALENPLGDESIEVRHQMKMQRRGDRSPLIAELKEQIESWDYLPEECRSSIIEGERRLADEASHDYFPVIMCFAKSVEIALKKLVFEAFAEDCGKYGDLDRHIRLGLDERFAQAANFMKFIQKGQNIELGAMLFSLRLCLGRTGREMILLGRLKEFIEDNPGTKGILGGAFFDDTEELLKLRNSAAHSSSFGENQAQTARQLAIRTLKLFNGNSALSGAFDMKIDTSR